MPAKRTQQRIRRNRVARRKGVILVMFALMLVMVFAFVSFAVDVGYMSMVRTSLQNAADGAALAGAMDLGKGKSAVVNSAQAVAQANQADGASVSLASADVEVGMYDSTTGTFTVSTSGGATKKSNAVRVTARATNRPLFFAPIMGTSKYTMQASAIAMLNPRDIAFVVDLSGSMNDDTEPCWSTRCVNDKFAGSGYPTIGNTLMTDVYTDLGFGIFPGTLEWVGAPAGVAADYYAYAELTKDNGPLTQSTVALPYRIVVTDQEDVRKTKAYKWIIDKQLLRLMPNAKPVPNSLVSSSYQYWEKYLDYVIEPAWVGIPPPAPPSSPSPAPAATATPDPTPAPDPGPAPPQPPPAVGWRLPLNGLDAANPFADLVTRSGQPRSLGVVAGPPAVLFAPLAGPLVASQSPGPGLPRAGSTTERWVPYSQDGDRIDGFNNPNYVSFPAGAGYEPWSWRNQLGYQTYVQFMMDWGRERSPDQDNSTNASPTVGMKTQLSALSPNCSWHTESTPAGNFNFPPREQPMHAVRRSMIAAMKIVSDQNAGLKAAVADQVSVVTYDAIDSYHQPTINQALTNNYTSAMTAATKLQACSDYGASTATENGVIAARNHIKKKSEGGQGRETTDKVIVLITDGMPNVWQSGSAAINAEMAARPSSDYYGTGYDWFNSVLMQTAQFQAKNGSLYPVGMGLGADYGFMDRIARIAKTDDGTGMSPRPSGNPADFEATLTDIFTKIVEQPRVRLVQ